MATSKQYFDRAAQIEKAGRLIGADYIVDECVDNENCEHCEQGSPEYWDAMMFSLENSAGTRLENLGLLKAFPIKLDY
jgi:hypothetical protein